MICFPLDNTPYEAKDMGTYLATRTRGVFSSDGNLAVTPGESGLSVSVSPGLAWLKWSDYWGTAALQEQALTLDLDTADGALKRIDAIVCRLDKVNNRAEIVVKKGAPSSAPIVVPPVRDANYDELYIATVLIGAGIVSISASAITDQRLNEEYCGLMRDGVTGIPTAQLQTQVQQLIDHGYQISLKEVECMAQQSTAIYKQHIMDVMIRHGYSDTIYSDVYRKLFKNNGICVCPASFVSVEAAIRAIHKDQGIAVLAHPYTSRVTGSIPEYVRIGLDGIETWHSSHGQKQVDDLHAIAKRYKLIETGGSDTHGRYGEEPVLGQVNPFMKDEDVSVCSRM